MLQKSSNLLYSKLITGMEKITSIDNPLERLKSGLVLVQQCLGELRLEFLQRDFGSEEEEIRFFKFDKPRIYAWLIFITEQYAMGNAAPVLGEEELKNYYTQQLSFIMRFFRQNEFLYQYYRIGADELDTRYFLRAGAVSMPGFSEVPEVDPSFATAADYLFSKFIAYEMLQEYLLARISELSRPPGTDIRPGLKLKQLRWTGDSCNIIELIYGIYETRQVNEGDVSIAELVEHLGLFFNINLSRYFKRFSEIKRRKAMSKTRFLEEMAKLVNKRIDDGDAWIPQSMR